MSDISASIARGRLQTIFARERDTTSKSDSLETPATETLTTSEHASVPEDKKEIKPSAGVDIPGLESVVEIQTPARTEALQTEASPRSHQLSTEGDAAKTANETAAMPASNPRASGSHLSGLWTAAAALAAAGAAWWVNGKPETNSSFPERPASPQAEFSPAPSNKAIETTTKELWVSPSKDIASTPAQTTSPAPPSEQTKQGGQGKLTGPPQAAAGYLGQVTHAELNKKSELAISSLRMEAKLAEFFRQAPNKSGEFDLDEISFDPSSAILRPSSSEQLQNIVKILKVHPKIKISVGAYIGPLTKKESSLKLSRARVNNVIRELSRIGYKSPITAQIYKKMPMRRSGESGETKLQEQRISLTVIKM